MTTFQLTTEGYSRLQEAGVVLEKPFSRFLLLDIYRMGYAYTGHTGTEIIQKQGELDFTNDPEPDTMFPTCSVCNSQEDLHLVEMVGQKHIVSIFCGHCRKKELARFDVSVPLPFVTRGVLRRLLTMKEIHEVDKSVAVYESLLNAEFSEKWKILVEAKGRKPVQQMLIDDALSDRLV